jgi:hypothetical protein
MKNWIKRLFRRPIILSEIIHTCQYEGFPAMKWIIVGWEHKGRKQSAAINSDLYLKHGLSALNLPDWYKGKRVDDIGF